MAQAAEFQGIVAALGSVLRVARMAGYGRHAADLQVSVRASLRDARAGGPLVRAMLVLDGGAGGHIDIMPPDPAAHAAGSAAALAHALEPSLARLEAMIQGTGIAAFGLTVGQVQAADASPARLEVVHAAVEGFDVVEATETWSWQNRFREPEAAALAIALVMAALAEADAGTDRHALEPFDVHRPSSRPGEADGLSAPTAAPPATPSTAIERALHWGVRLDAVDAGHARRRYAAWIRGMRRATGRPEFAAIPEDRLAASAARPDPDLDAALRAMAFGRPLAAAE